MRAHPPVADMQPNNLVDYASAFGRRRTGAPLRSAPAGHQRRYALKGALVEFSEI